MLACGRRGWLTGQLCVVHQELQPLSRIPQLPPEFEHGDIAGSPEELDEGHQLLCVGRDLADFLCDAAVLVANAAEQKPAISTTASASIPTRLMC